MIPQHPALIPPEPPPEPNRRGEGLVVVVAAVVGAVAVLGGLVAFQQWRNNDASIESADAAVNPDEGVSAEEQAPDSTDPPAIGGRTPSTLAPDSQDSDSQDSDSQDSDSKDSDSQDSERGEDESGSSVETVACPDGVIQPICDAAEYVQQARGRPFKNFPEVTLMEDAEFDAALTRDLDEYRGDIEEDERVLKALGLLSDDIELFSTYESFIELGVVGFYRTDTKELVVRGAEFNLYGQLVLVHELVHAFDDQWHNLDREDFANDDQEYAFSAVIEGNARRVENRWRSDLSIEDQGRLTQQELSAIPVEDLNLLLAIPQIVLNLQLSPYEDGERYVDGIFEAGGEEAINSAFERPPTSSEQILHPEGSGSQEQTVIELTAPPADGTETSGGALGELLISFWLGVASGEGWGGDSYVIWESGSESCLTVDIAADSEADLAEIEASAQRWAQSRSQLRQVSMVDAADRSVVRVTGCFNPAS